MKLKWYLRTWFIVLMAALWPIYGIPLLISFILIYLQSKEYKILERNYGDMEAVNKYISQKNVEAEDIIKAANTKADQILAEAASVEGQANKLIEDAKQKGADINKAWEEKVNTLKASIKQLKNEEMKLKTEIDTLNKKVVLEAINLSPYESVSSEECKDKLVVLRMKQDELIKADKALVVTSEDSKKILNNNVKQLLRCFNSESKAIISNVTVKNVETARGNIKKSFEVLNKIFSTDGVALSYEYLEMKLEELNLVYASELKREEEREIQRAIREQLLEEEKVRKEIEREKAKIEKEEAQFKNEAGKLMKYLQKCTNDIEKNLYIEKIKELEDKLKLLEKDKENVLQREQNTRAGFVYIISNIGSFGESVYKIGMTRRLEPMDRIKELSDASVPFPFDVHAIIFSEDAPALENILHQTFRSHEVNKVNSRKEFFKVSLDNIKSVVTENYNATVQFIDIADATEYRESLRLNELISA